MAADAAAAGGEVATGKEERWRRHEHQGMQPPREERMRLWGYFRFDLGFTFIVRHQNTQATQTSSVAASAR